MIERTTKEEAMNAAEKNYLEVKAACDEVSRQFGEAQKAYRSRQIGDAEFLAAKKAFDESRKKFDAAFASVANW